jgi:hypothetical protein
MYQGRATAGSVTLASCPMAALHRRGHVRARAAGRVSSAVVPPIEELTRPLPIDLARLQRNGIFTTGLLLEVSETRTRRQYLADQVGASLFDVMRWRDEAFLLNLAGFGSDEHFLFAQAGIEGLADLLAIDRDELHARLEGAAVTVGVSAPDALTVDSWWEQAHTLEEA